MYLRTQVQSDEIMTEITASSTGGSRDSYTRAQAQSMPISAHQCHQWQLAMALTDGSERRALAVAIISGHHRSSVVAISGHQRQSAVIRAHQRTIRS